MNKERMDKLVEREIEVAEYYNTSSESVDLHKMNSDVLEYYRKDREDKFIAFVSAVCIFLTIVTTLLLLFAVY